MSASRQVDFAGYATPEVLTWSSPEANKSTWILRTAHHQLLASAGDSSLGPYIPRRLPGSPDIVRFNPKSPVITILLAVPNVAVSTGFISFPEYSCRSSGDGRA